MWMEFSIIIIIIIRITFTRVIHCPNVYVHDHQLDGIFMRISFQKLFLTEIFHTISIGPVRGRNKLSD